ncbi:MAG: hypothetical protein IT536_08940 [Hyphomicrobiales bacterium]|nr:hypothetical protein [Hyphomicrobiales bacterium]
MSIVRMSVVAAFIAAAGATSLAQPVDLLKSAAAKAICERHGFTVLVKPGS